jgi:hypothetical protein
VLYILVRLVNLEKCHSCAVGCATYAGTMPAVARSVIDDSININSTVGL